MVKTRIITTVIGSCMAVGIGFYAYRFFGDCTTPVLEIKGLEENHYYRGEIACGIMSSKSGEFSLWIDGSPYGSSVRVSGQRYHPLTIATSALSPGKHQALLVFADNTYHRNRVEKELSFFVDNESLQAALLQGQEGLSIAQGRTYHVRFQANKPIKNAVVNAFEREHACFAESKGSLTYEAFVPVACEELPQQYPVCVEIADHVGNKLKLEHQLTVQAYPFKKEVLHVTAERVKEEEAMGADASGREKAIAALVDSSVHEKLWRGQFCTPIDIKRISCDFGTIRTTQHKGRYAHKALDVINDPKSVVWAPQDGIVMLKERFADSGNTIAIDHGWGIISLFYHLDDFAKVNVGDKVAKGNPIGAIGKTGYATGYHLHWEMRVNNVPIDPMQWTRTTF